MYCSPNIMTETKLWRENAAGHVTRMEGNGSE